MICTGPLQGLKIGVACSTVVGIICPLGWDRVNCLAKAPPAPRLRRACSYSTCHFHQATYTFHAQIHVMGKFWCAANWLECEWFFIDICFCLCFGFRIELVIEWVTKSQASILQILVISPILDKIIYFSHYLSLLLWFNGIKYPSFGKISSHSAYDATSTESNGVKINGFLYPNFM